MFMYQRTPADVLFQYDKDTLVATTRIITRGARKQSEFVAYATCHEKDRDFASETTGRTISSNRAYIKYLKSELSIVLDKLAVLEYLSNSVILSPKYNKKGFTEKKLRKLISVYDHGAQRIRADIKEIESSTKEFIKLKTEVWEKIRRRREWESKRENLVEMLEENGVHQKDNPFKNYKEYMGMTYLGELNTEKVSGNVSDDGDEEEDYDSFF